MRPRYSGTTSRGSHEPSLPADEYRIHTLPCKVLPLKRIHLVLIGIVLFKPCTTVTIGINPSTSNHRKDSTHYDSIRIHNAADQQPGYPPPLKHIDPKVVYVRSEPRLRMQPVPRINVLEGHSFRINCRIDKLDGQPRWIKGSLPIFISSYRFQPKELAFGNIALIGNLTAGDHSIELNSVSRADEGY